MDGANRPNEARDIAAWSIRKKQTTTTTGPISTTARSNRFCPGLGFVNKGFIRSSWEQQGNLERAK